MRVLLAFAITLILGLTACDKRRNIEEYYFPTHDLHDGLVYVFQAVSGDTSEREYWYYKSFKRDSGLFFTATYYDPSLEIRQIVREKITESGALARNYFLYEADQNGISHTINARLEEPNTFPFSVKDSTGVFLFSLKFESPSTPGTQYLIRNRRFLGDGPNFGFKGQSFQTIRFGLKEVYGNEQEGSAEIEGVGEEHYAKGIGLVYYEKNVANGALSYAFQLVDTMSMDAFLE